jgi:uncharacterized protein YutD
MKTLLLGDRNSIFFTSIKTAWPYLNVCGEISEHAFSKSQEVVEYVKKHNYTHVLMPNPYGNNRRLNCYLSLQKSNISIISSDRGALPNSWFFDSGFNSDSGSYKMENWNHEITQEDHNDIEQYINSLKILNRTLETNGMRVGKEAIKEKLSIREGIKIVFVPLQRPNDTVIKYMSGRVKSLKNFISWVEKIDAILNKENTQYIFLLKKHPLEIEYFPVKSQTKTIKYVSDSTHIYDLIEIADSILLINSGVGLLSLAFNKKVVCTGNAFYAHRGLAHTATSAEHAASLICKAQLPQKERVYRFYRHLLKNVYSFGEFTTSTVVEGSACRTVTEKIDFNEIRILGKEVFLKDKNYGNKFSKRRVLFVVPLAPIPIYRGNQTRVDAILKSALARADLEVHICIMNRSFKNKTSIDYEKELMRYYSNAASIKVVKGINLEPTLKDKMLHLLYRCHKRFFAKNSIINLSDCPPKFIRAVRAQINRFKINNVFINYAYSMPVVPKNFNGRIVLDTHDFQYYHLIDEQAINNTKPYINPDKFLKSEINIINKADLIIAINPNEQKAMADFLKNQKQVITLPHFSKCNDDNIIPFCNYNYDALFLGSIANFNVTGLLWFLKNVFPFLIEKKPDFSFAVVGDICKNNTVKKIAADNSANIKLLGRVSTLESAYSQSKVVISPILGGAGMKIKVIESLSYGKCVIGTSKAFDGICDSKNKAVIFADTADKFIKSVLKYSTDDKLRSKVEVSAVKFFNKNYSVESQKNTMDSIFDGFISA